jgi:hypothetical protein
MNDWIEVNVEKSRTMYFKSNPSPLTFINVTHYKKYDGEGSMISDVNLEDWDFQEEEFLV